MSARVPPVAVVGAGLDARVAALRLARAGTRVAWLETAEPDAGSDGRARTAGAGDVAVEGPLPGVVPASTPGLMGLAAELGLGKVVRRAALPTVALLPAGRPAWLQTAADPLEAGLSGPMARRRARRLLRWYGGWLDPRAPERGGRLDDRSVADWCRLYLGRRNLDGLLSPCLAAHFGLDSADTSRLFALLLLDPAGRPGLGQVSGLGELRQRIDAELARVKRTPRVRQVLDGGRRLRLDNGRTMRARATVLAVPAERVSSYTDDLTPAERAMLPRIRTVDRLCLVLRVPARAAPRARVRWVPGSAPGPLAALVTPDPPESAGTLESDERMVVLVARRAFAEASRSRADTDVCQTMLYAAEHLLPGIHAAVQGRELWRDGTTPAFGVGHYRAVERLHLERERNPERALFLCGGYQIAPHAEGDVVAGTRSAERCLDWCASS